MDSAATIKRAGSGSGVFFEGVGKGIVEVLIFFGKGLLVLTGIVLALSGLMLLIALFACTLGWTGMIYSDSEFTLLSFPRLANLLLGCNMPVIYLQMILLAVLGIPLFMLFYNGLRMVFRFNRVRHLGLTMFNIWIIGIIFLAWAGFRIFNLYKFEEEKKIEIALEKPAADTLNIVLMPDDPGLKFLRNEKYLLMGDQTAIMTSDRELFMVPGIRFEEADDSVFSVSQVTLARGKTHWEARQHMASIRFQSAATGTTLKIGPFARLPKEECWRGEAVNLIIHVPQGKYIRFDQRLFDLKPNWYYMMDSSHGSVFKMTDSGIEPIIPGQDSATSDTLAPAP